MAKRGIGSAVDWIVALGIFLVYFGLVFVFFKPGVQDVFEPETILDIVEENVLSNIEWSMSKTPIFVEKVGDGLSDSEEVFINGFSDQTGYNASGKSKILNVGEDEEKENDGNGKDKLENAGKKSEFLKQKKKNDNKDPKVKLEFDTNGKTKFVLLNANKVIDDSANEEVTDTEVVPGKKVCTLKEHLNVGEDEENPCGAAYAVGASESLRGINLDNVEILRQAVAFDYDEVKDTWKFPAIKDFRIVIYSKSEGLTFEEADNTAELVIGMQRPSVDTQVYVREFNTFYLSEDGVRVPITLNIRVW